MFRIYCLLLVIVGLVSCGGGSKNDSSGGIPFSSSIETLDYTSRTGYAISIAVDTSGNPGVSYTNASNTLYFALKKSGTWTKKTAALSSSSLYSMTSTTINSSGIFSILYSDYHKTNSTNVSSLYEYQSSTLGAVTLDSTAIKAYPVIATDKADTAHVAYYDGTNKVLTYAKRTAGTWSTPEVVDSTLNAGLYPAIAVDGSSNVHLVYYDSNSMSMKYATNKSGSWVVAEVATGINKTGSGYSNDDERYWSIAADSNGFIHISFFDYSASSLKYATNLSGTWVVTILDSGSKGRSNSLGIDSKNKIHISYYNQSLGSLRYITNKSGSWIYTDIEGSTGTTSCGFPCSLAVDSSDNIHIGYKYTFKDLNTEAMKYVKLTY